MRHLAVLAMNPATQARRLFNREARAQLDRLVDVHPTVISTLDSPSLRVLRRADLVIGGWGAPRLTPDLAPALRAVIFLGGSAASCLAEHERWRSRDLHLSNTRAVNARPVAEYALAMILLAGKDAFVASQSYRTQGVIPHPASVPPRLGNAGRIVGIVGLAQVARILIRLLEPFDVQIVVYDPWASRAEAEQLGVRLAELDELMAISDVVSLHQALTPQTTGQIDARRLSLMRDGATLLNTARGAVVDQSALTRELRSGRLRAILDVTDPEPLPPDHPLWRCENAFITPHVAGSSGGELQRMGDAALEEVRRFVNGQPFAYPESAP